ncbi:SpaA isopeptide-forming pilin-related protein [Microbacterium indicum]|uniref:SpaA isopeptide-forming pilin-related protein n=1 Tax=Microbacterium indicum TaxID=358100 RepID=UPI0003FEC3EB|nr:SpaA isopeptide-forming pilin-related protein [Microbacterium indicum]
MSSRAGIVAAAAAMILAIVGLPATPLGAADAATAAVPTPSSSQSVVTVKVGGDRTGGTSVAGLAGVVLHLERGSASAPNGTRPDGVAGDGAGWARCVSDSAGDCSFVVPNTNGGGANRNAQFWVTQESAPAGWFLNDAIRTGDGSGANSESTAYRFRTPELTARSTYSSTSTVGFMLTTSPTASTDTAATRTASGGTWQVSRANPELPLACGLDVALVLDLSNSVSNNGDLDALKGQASTLVDALVGTPSRMSLFSFGSYSPALTSQANVPQLTSVSTQAGADAFKSSYRNWVTPTLAGQAIRGGTNWDQGLYVPAVAAGAPGATGHYDVAIVITDGNPTMYGPNPTSGDSSVSGSGNFTRDREVENAVFSANALKAKGTRVLAVGVGTGITDPTTARNLQALSGPVRYDPAQGNALDADYYQIADVSDAGAALRSLIEQQCASSLNVTKMLVPSDAADGDVSGAVPAGAGWSFTASSDDAGTIEDPATRTTIDDGTGTVSFPLSMSDGADERIEIREAQHDGYAFVSAQCSVRSEGSDAPRDITVLADDLANPGFSLTVEAGEQVNCTVYNTEDRHPADVQVDKTWVVNGTEYANGDQPDALRAELALTSSGSDAAKPQDWATIRDGYEVGDDVGIGEAMSFGDMQRCELVEATIVEVNGDAVSLDMAYAVDAAPADDALTRIALDQEHNTIVVRNEITCTSELTLVKQVEGGSADPTDWTLDAIAPSGAAAGPRGATGSPEATGVVTADATYALAESGGDPRYAQVDERARPLALPDSTGSWQCVLVDADGAVISDVIDGADGGATVPLGQAMRCTAVNQTASITLLKHVVDPIDGGDTASDWSLTASPAEGVSGLEASVVTGAEEDVDGASTVNVRPDHTYTVSEDGPAGYRPTLQVLTGDDPHSDASWEEAPDADPDAEGVQISVAALDHETYRLVNERMTGSIAWSKAVSGTVGDGSPAGSPLAGSTWQITGPGYPADAPLVVEDADLSGSFLVDGLDWGEYTVTETAAPVGYVLADPAPSFTAVISGAALDFVLDSPVENPQRQIILPDAGGTGSWPYLAGGALILLVGIGVWALSARRARRP